MQQTDIYQVMFMHATIGILIAKNDGTIFKANTFAEKLFGYAENELDGQLVEILVPEAFQGGHANHRRSYHQKPKDRVMGANLDLFAKRKDGTTLPVEISLGHTEFGGEKMAIAYINDITKQKESQQKIEEHSHQLEQKVIERTAELRESEEKLKQAQSIAKMGHWDWLLAFRRMTFSKGMYQIYGLVEDIPVSSELLNDLIHPEDRDFVNQQIETIIQHKKETSITHRIITPTGQLKYVRSNIQVPIIDKNGNIIRLFGVSKDITQQKESENQLHEALNKEKELGMLKSRFVSMASHEFRTPLSSILSSTELLGMYLESGRHEKCGRNINRIKNSVRNLTGILNDFLSLEKLEAGKVEVQLSNIELADYLDELLDEIRPILRPEQQLIFETNQLTTLQTDPYLLKNIHLNLISNAIKYSPNGENVTLSISEEKEQWMFKVMDKGIGIPDADKQHMFSRFFRASNVENIKGTGLGLTIVKRYLDLMGGDIDFESEYGKGSTFYFHLPRQ